jgi:LL-H family phage holin
MKTVKEMIKMNDVLFMILKVVVIVAVTLITRYLVPWIKAQNDSSTRSLIYEVIETGVKAAEQTITGSGKGAEKKAKVEAYVIERLADLGISIDADQLDELIEESVYILNNPTS